MYNDEVLGSTLNILAVIYCVLGRLITDRSPTDARTSLLLLFFLLHLQMLCFIGNTCWHWTLTYKIDGAINYRKK